MKPGALFFLLACLTAPLRGAILEKVRLASDGDQVFVEFSFRKDSLASRIPRFFQHFEAETGIYSINFLETGSSIIYGNYPIARNNPYVSHMAVRKVIGKNHGKVRGFLSVGFSLRTLNRSSKYKASKSNAGTINLALGKSRGDKFHWTVSPSTQPISEIEGSSHILLAQNENPDESIQLPPPTVETPDTGNPREIQAEDSVKLEDVLGTESAFDLGTAMDRKTSRLKTMPGKTFSISEENRDYIALSNRIKLRDAPGTGSQTIRTIHAGEKVTGISRKKDWFQVYTGKDTGWVKNNLLAYEDKLTPEQRKSIKTQQAEREAEEMRLAAKQKAEEEARKQKELAAKQRAEEEALKKKELEPKQRAEEEAKKKEEKLARKKAGEEKRKKEEEILNLKRKEKLRLEEKRKAEQERIEREQEMARILAEKKRIEEQEKRKRERERKKVQYTSFGRRDPFIPVEHAPLSDRDIILDQMKLVGIIWNAKDPLAVLEHRTEPAISIALRKGDSISNGKVTQITRHKVVFEISEYGVFRFYTLKLKSPKERMLP
ncbi:SH3 domain-containing protein [Fibrobacterota bacterium]